MPLAFFSSTWLGAVAALVSGFLLPFSLAPYNYWALSIISPVTLALLLRRSPEKKRVFWKSFVFGLGFFGSGVSWIYISIHDFGFTGAPLATLMTGLFVVFLAFVFALPFVIFSSVLKPNLILFSFLFPGVWVIGEWLRSWLFSGFPWLYVGYAHLDTYLASWAPLTGVFGISFLSIACGLLFISAIKALTGKQQNDSQITKSKPVIKVAVCLFAAALIWIIPYQLREYSWTRVKGDIQSVAILQPNVELYKKWNPIHFSDIFSGLYALSDRHWDTDIQVWPEAAIPSVFNNVRIFTSDIDEKARTSGTNVFSGILYDNADPYEVYNSIIGLGAANGTYFKQKLVPFGEYVPFEDQLRGLIQFFDLPNSVIRKGPLREKALTAKTKDGDEYFIAPFICYEVVYPDFVAKNAASAKLLLTISNDAWFGSSSGPLQHFEMVRMRALENQKYMLRATNTGISGIIDDKGRVLIVSEQFKETTIKGYVELREGVTPFSRFGSYPILLIIFGLLGTFFIRTSLKSRSGHTQDQ